MSCARQYLRGPAAFQSRLRRPVSGRPNASVRRKICIVRSQWRAHGREPTSAIAACDQVMLDGSEGTDSGRQDAIRLLASLLSA